MTENLLKGFPKKETSEYLNFKPNKPISGKSVKGDVGLELEMEGTRLPNEANVSSFSSSKLGRRWTVHPDGSLRNGGVEYVLDQPCLEEEVPEMVDALFKVFDVNKTTLDLTQRTSTHVHINVSSMRANTLTSYLVLWYIFEEALVNWCGESRAGNLFCLRGKDSSFIPEQWASALKNGSFKFPNDYKYSSLNLGAFSRFGSFEFRSLRGCESPKLVIDWTRLLMALRKEAETEYDNPSRIVEIMSAESPDMMFRNLCDKYSLTDFCDEVLNLPENIDFNKMCWNGFRNIQKIIYEINWDKIIDKCREKYVPNPFASEKTKKATVVRDMPGGLRWLQPNEVPAFRAAPMPRMENEPDIELDPELDEDENDEAPEDTLAENRPREADGWMSITDRTANVEFGGLPPARTVNTGLRITRPYRDTTQLYDLWVYNDLWYYRARR